MSTLAPGFVSRAFTWIVLPLALSLPRSLPAASFVRGDVNSDRRHDITDAIRVLGFLFLGEPVDLGCDDAADLDDNGLVQITDPVYLLGYLFLGGQTPMAPFPDCSADPTPDSLGCVRFDRCDVAGSAPTLSGVTGPTLTAAGEQAAILFHFQDPDGDIQVLHLSVENALGTWDTDLGAPFLDLSGLEGDSRLPLRTTGLPFGRTKFKLELRDSRGRASSVETHSLDVVSAAPGGSAPAIHGFDPQHARWNRPVGLAVTSPRFRLDYSDADGDIDRIRIRVALPSGQEAVTEHQPGVFGIRGPAGVAERAFFTFRATSPTGVYALEVTLLDRAGNASVPAASSVELVEAGGEPALTISSIEPNSGLPGTTVILRGTGFDAEAPEKNLVELGEMPSEVVSAGAHEVTVRVPEGAVSGRIALSNARGKAVSPTVFSVPGRIVLDPPGADVSAGSAVQFRAEVLASGPRDLVWKVNGVTGGRAEIGTVSSEGLYAAPAALPPGGEVSVTAELARDATIAALARVGIVAPSPGPGASWVLSSIGAEVSSADRESGAIIPPGALQADTLITVSTISPSSLPPPPAGLRTLGAVELGPEGSVFHLPVTVILPLSRFFPPGTMLPVSIVDATGGGYLDEGLQAEVLDDGERARTAVEHFSTYSIHAAEPEGMAYLPRPSITSLTSTLPLEEGRRVPILITGQDFTPDMVVSVVDADGNPTRDITPGSLYALQDRAGVLLHIGTIPEIGSPSQPVSRTYKLQLRNVSFGVAAEHEFQVTGLPELFVPSGGIAELSGEHHFSEARVAGTLLVPEGDLSLRVTGPVTVTGVIDAHGEDGRPGEDRLGGSPSLTGGPGGFGREDNGCFLGIDLFGACDYDGAEQENFGQHGSGCVGFPADPPDLQGFCDPLESERSLPKGMGGTPGVNTTLLEGIPEMAVNLGKCVGGDEEACRAVIVQQQELLFSIADAIAGRYTGRRGLGAGIPVPGRPTGGGGGGGAGRMQLHIPTGLLVAELELSLNGGGGGGGGGSGKSVRISTPDTVTLTESRPDGSQIHGRVSTEGGSGGRGSTQGALTLSPSAAGFLDLAEVRLFGMPAFPGGGAGGGAGGTLTVEAGLGAFFSSPDQLSARGGTGGEGGVTTIADNGLARSEVAISHASNGPAGSRILSRPLFRPDEIATGVTNRAFFRLHASRAPGTQLEVRHEDGSSSHPSVPAIGEALLLVLPQGLNTITAAGLPEELEIHLLVLGSDADGDGLSDADEADLRTDPHRSDTDSDGLTDAQEVILGLSPLRPDTDNDGLPDASELALGSDAARRDSDSDGVWDGAEVVLGTSPVNATSVRKSIPRGALLAQAGGDLAVVDPATGGVGILGRVDLLGYGLTIDAGTNVIAAVFDRLASVDPLGADALGDLPQSTIGLLGNGGGSPIRTSQLAFNPASDRIHAVELGPGPDFQPTGQLLEIRGDTGEASRIGGALAERIDALAFDSTGKLFASIATGADPDRLVELDPSSGAIAREIGSIGADHVLGLAFGPGGELHGTAWVSSSETRILRIDLNTGQGTTLSTASRGLFGIAFMPCPAPCLLPPVPIPVTSQLFAVEIVDLDQDGKADAVACGKQGSIGKAFRLRGKGDGTFEPAASFTVGSRPQEIAVADLNVDGALDLVTANRDSQGVTVLLNDAAGGFTRADLAAGGTTFTLNAAAAGDLNGDGFPDLAAGVFVGVGNQGFGTGNVRVWLNDGAGGFGAFSTVPLTDSGIKSIAMADLNRDGRMDVIVGHFFGASIAVLRGDGAGGFSSTTLLGEENLGVNRLAVADLDGDGAEELVLPFTEGSGVGILQNDGAGGMGSAALHPIDPNASTFHIVSAVVIADFTGEGKPDLLASSELAGKISVLLGGRNFAPSAASPAAVGGRLVDVAAGDLNGDGRLDAVTCDSDFGKLYILLNSASF